jgi:hypothetical protein
MILLGEPAPSADKASGNGGGSWTADFWKAVGDHGQVTTDRDQLKTTFGSGGTAVPLGTA